MKKRSLTKKDKFDLNVGIETLTLMRMAGYHMDKLSQIKNKGLFSILDLESHFEKRSISDFKFAINLKIKLFDKEYIEYCCKLAILVYEKCDIDLIQSLKDPKELIKPKSKLNALDFKMD